MKPWTALALVCATALAEAQPVAVRFVAFGDFGKGIDAQHDVGRAMATVCAARGCDFALMLGDNLYPSGASDVHDRAFDERFERPLERLRVPVWVVLGNHDNGTNGGAGELARGDIEVAYHSRPDRLSDKWRMPARYYAFTAPAGAAAPLAEFFALDSNPLAATDDDPDPRWDPGPYAERQLAWLRQAVAASTARWKIAFAHHPFLSNGWHGNAGSFYNGPRAQAETGSGVPWRDLVQAGICRQGLDFLFQGHDHDLQWLQPLASCGKTQFITSGAAASPYPFRRDVNPAYWQQDRKLGFVWIELRQDDMTGAFYTLEPRLAGGERWVADLTYGGDGKPAPAFEQTRPWEPEP